MEVESVTSSDTTIPPEYIAFTIPIPPCVFRHPASTGVLVLPTPFLCCIPVFATQCFFTFSYCSNYARAVMRTRVSSSRVMIAVVQCGAHCVSSQLYVSFLVRKFNG